MTLKTRKFRIRMMSVDDSLLLQGTPITVTFSVDLVTERKRPDTCRQNNKKFFTVLSVSCIWRKHIGHSAARISSLRLEIEN
jgi:hypothetical protein